MTPSIYGEIACTSFATKELTNLNFTCAQAALDRLAASQGRAADAINADVNDRLMEYLYSSKYQPLQVTCQMRFRRLNQRLYWQSTADSDVCDRLTEHLYVTSHILQV